jgi:hypothetical protein
MGWGRRLSPQHGPEPRATPPWGRVCGRGHGRACRPVAGPAPTEFFQWGAGALSPRTGGCSSGNLGSPRARTAHTGRGWRSPAPAGMAGKRPPGVRHAPGNRQLVPAEHNARRRLALRLPVWAVEAGKPLPARSRPGSRRRAGGGRGAGPPGVRRGGRVRRSSRGWPAWGAPWGFLAWVYMNCLLCNNTHHPRRTPEPTQADADTGVIPEDTMRVAQFGGARPLRRVGASLRPSASCGAGGFSLSPAASAPGAANLLGAL